MRPTVLIVDDHADFRASARALLEAEGFDVVGEAADGKDAMADVERVTVAAWGEALPRSAARAAPNASTTTTAAAAMTHRLSSRPFIGRAPSPACCANHLV